MHFDICTCTCLLQENSKQQSGFLDQIKLCRNLRCRGSSRGAKEFLYGIILFRA